MSNLPFGFGPPDPDKRGENDPSGQSGQGQSGSDSFNQLGQMLSQLGQMLSQAGSSSGPVNYDLAKQIAMQRLSGEGGARAGFTSPSADSADSAKAVRDSAHLAELWLDTATTLPAGATSAETWSARDWVEKTLPTWQRLCDPVAKQVSNAWTEALPDEAKQAAGPLLSMVNQMGGMAFGSQLGNAMAQLGSDVLTSTEVGLPLGPAGTSALLPANIEKFTEGLDRPSSEVLVFLAARESAHHRLFSYAPWLRERLLDSVEEFAHGITVDTSAIEQLASQIDPSNPASIEEAMSSGLLEPTNTNEQQAALTRIETMLALVEGWVDVVVAEAVGDRLPGSEALRETLRRRRATGGPAEQTFATLVGLELRPRKLRAASSLWNLIGEKHGMTKRDELWAHPDLMPTAEDLDAPEEFAERLGAGEHADMDPITELMRTEQAEDAEAASEDSTGSTGSGERDADNGNSADSGDSGDSGEAPPGESEQGGTAS